MNYNKVIFALLGIGILGSCSKDEINVVKNTDLSYNIDKKLVEDDIRTRVGYDPRLEGIGFATSRAEAPILLLGNSKIEEEQIIRIPVAVKQSEQDLTLTMKFNKDLFEDVKSDYSEGYVVGDESMFEVEQDEKVVKSGEFITSFTVKIKNKGQLSGKILLPFVLGVKNESDIKVNPNKNIFVVDIFEKAINVKSDSEQHLASIMINKRGEVEYMTSSKVPVKIYMEDKILSDIFVRLERVLETQQDAEGVLLPEKYPIELSEESIRGKNEISYNINLPQPQDYQGIDEGDYYIPFKVKVFDKNTGKEMILPDLVYVKLKVYSVINVVAKSSANSYDQGEKLDKNSMTIGVTAGASISQNNLELLKDDGASTEAFKLQNKSTGYLYFKLPLMKKMKGFQLKINPNKPIKSVDVYSCLNEMFYGWNFFTEQGTAKFTQSGEYLIVTFKNPVSAQYLLLTNISGEDSVNDFEIYEVDIFEE